MSDPGIPQEKFAGDEWDRAYACATLLRHQIDAERTEQAQKDVIARTLLRFKAESADLGPMEQRIEAEARRIGGSRTHLQDIEALAAFGRWAVAQADQYETSVLQAVLDAIKGTLDPHTQIADHPNVKFAQMQRLKWEQAAAKADPGVEAIRQLVERWRCRAAEKRGTFHLHSERAIQAMRQCADELEALINGITPQLSKES